MPLILVVSYLFILLLLSLFKVRNKCDRYSLHYKEYIESESSKKSLTVIVLDPETTK